MSDRKEQCNRLIQSMVGPDWVQTWWDSQNRAFQGRTPSEQWILDSEEVYEYLMQHAYCW